uniref:Muscle M-line assembly protein unc-89 n=1 Tax=Acrobeloides nanus TaxID=290746 RepID=A0A914D5Y7_9BILA
MASRKQRQFERKYSSYKKYTATEDVNYRSHSARSTYRQESATSKVSPSGRSTSSEVVTGSETRTLPVFIAIQDYTPDESDSEAIPLEQGQIVEVLDNKNAAAWLVRTKARPPRTGWVPGSYFETPTEFYKQRRRTRELTSNDIKMSEEQEAILKRDQVYHDLLHTEEEFVSDLRILIDSYISFLEDPSAPPEVQKKKSELLVNIRELYNFHANVLLKGLQYYSDDPGKVGQTFVKLEHDFDHHVQFHRELPYVLQLIEEDPEIKTFIQVG